MVRAAVPVTAAINGIECIARQQERAALALGGRRKGHAGRRHRRLYVQRPICDHRSVREQERIDHLPRPVSSLDQRIEIKHAGIAVDDRRSGDAFRIDVSARQLGQRYRRRKLRLPHCRARNRVERVHAVGFGGDDHDTVLGARCLIEERLGVYVPRDRRLETAIGVDVGGACKRQSGYFVRARTVNRIVIGRNIFGCSGQAHEKRQCRQNKALHRRSPSLTPPTRRAYPICCGNCTNLIRDGSLKPPIFIRHDRYLESRNSVTVITMWGVSLSRESGAAKNSALRKLIGSNENRVTNRSGPRASTMAR